MIAVFLLLTLLYVTSENTPSPKTFSVKVFHFLLKHWGESHEGEIDCGPNIQCIWTYSDHIKHLKQNYEQYVETYQAEHPNPISLSLYNIHSWWEKTRDHRPAICELPTNLTMVESEEAKVRYNHLFEPSFKHFDGYSTTHPSSHLQRVYKEAFLNESFLSKSTKSHSSLVKAASYVASDCHRRDNANANRDGVVQLIRNEGIRVDGLGRCMRSAVGPEGITLPNTHNTRYNLQLKRDVLSKYMFNLAFENSVESGYVTEKPFDALIAGTVPVYLGDAEHLKQLLPHPAAAIYVSDFNNNFTALAAYLAFLSMNETAYEGHRSAWRHSFVASKAYVGKPLLERSWACRVCDWAIQEMSNGHNKSKKICDKLRDASTQDLVKGVGSGQLNGRAIRGSTRTVYLVVNGTLRHVPDMDMFFALKLELDKVLVFPDKEIERLVMGPPLQNV